MFSRDHDRDAIPPQPLESVSDVELPGPAIPISTSRRRQVPRRSTTRRNPTAFTKLPVEAIELILWWSDSNTFASLAILNRQWNTVASDPELYAYHLSKCPSYALSHHVITKPSQLKNLRWLKATFAQEVRRNLFEAFLQPSETVVDLISTSASSSAAFPRGEALRFVFSSQGRTLLALSSSRIYVIDLLSEPLMAQRELRTVRRPLSAAVTNDGSLLALLSTKHQANIYGLTEAGVSHLQVIILDHPPRTIALANERTVLAAGYEGGVEVFSLAANALSTDRRAVRCEAVDSMSFSADGSMLLGSSYDHQDSNTVVISAPFYTENDPNLSTRDLHSRMWTTQILFPQNSSTCSHAAALNSHSEGDINWLFVYDRSLHTYRAVRADDTRTGVAYFLGPNRHQQLASSPSMLPSITLNGELAVAGFSGAGVYIYGIPERIDNAPDMSHVFEWDQCSGREIDLSLTSATGNRAPLAVYSPPLPETEKFEDDFLSGSLDCRRGLFVRPRPLVTFDDAVAATWVEDTSETVAQRKAKRLAVVAPGVVSGCPGETYEEHLPVDGGRILLLDFDYAPHTPVKKKITIEVGEKVPEELPEQRGDLQVEVDLVKRRSLLGTIDPERRRSLGRSVTAILSPSAAMGTHAEERGSRESIPQPPSPTFGPRPADLVRQSNDRFHQYTSEGLQRSASATGLQSARYPSRPPLKSIQDTSREHPSQRHADGQQFTLSPQLGKKHDRGMLPPPYRRSPEQSLHERPSIRRASTISPELAPRLREPFRPVPPPSIRLRDARATSAFFSRPPSTARQGGGETRPRGVSECTISTWSTLGSSWQSRRPGDSLSRAHSLSYSVSPLSSPRTPRAQGYQPSESPIRMRANILSPMFDMAMQQRFGEGPVTPIAEHPGMSSIMAPAVPQSGRSATTLTGANLQNRLNHPVPPWPSGSSQGPGSASNLAPLRVERAVSSTRRAASGDSEPRAISRLTSDHIATPDQHVFDSRCWSLSNPPATNIAAAPDQQHCAVHNPSQAHASWGVVGVPRVVASNKARKSSGNRTKARSREKQRPSSVANWPASESRYLGTPNNMNSLDLTLAPQPGWPHPPSPLADSIPYEQRRAATCPKMAQGRKQRKSGKASGDGTDGGKKGRLSRCVVM